MAKRKWAKKIGWSQGSNVQKNPYGDFKKEKAAVTQEFSPYYNKQTDTYIGNTYGRGRDDLNKSISRGTEDYNTNNERLQMNLAAARDQRDLIEGQERQGYNQNLGSRQISSSSPAALGLKARLDRIQNMRSTEQERGFSESQFDLNRGNERFRTDTSTSGLRLSEDEELYRKEREEALRQMIAQEVSARGDQAYQNRQY